MKSFLVACVALVVIAVGCAFVLDGFQEAASDAYVAPASVRI